MRAFATRFSLEVARDQRYPRSALSGKQQGMVEVRVRVGRDGRVQDISIDKTSGVPALDQEALDKVRRLRTLPRVPDEARGREFVVTIPIVFKIQD